MEKQIKKIIKDLKSGKLDRQLDEKYAEGFWDFAGDIVYGNSSEEMQEEIYYAFYAIVEECLNKNF